MVEKTGSFLASGGARENKVNLGNNKLSYFLFHFGIGCDFLQADPWVGSSEPLISGQLSIKCCPFKQVGSFLENTKLFLFEAYRSFLLLYLFLFEIL